MSRLSREMAIIPRMGWILTFGIVGAIALAVLIFPDDPDLGERAFIAGILTVAFIVYGLLVSYVYSDSKRRGMRPVLWTLVAAFVPNALGFIVYFLMREQVLQSCKQCGTQARREFAFCPSCGGTLHRACPACRKTVEPIWTHCAHCGTPLDASTTEVPADNMRARNGAPDRQDSAG